MHIAWSFLDKRSAAIAAVRAYKNMSFIIENTPDNIREQIIIMCSPNSSQISETPRVHNPHGGETRLAAIIDELDVLRKQYRQALEYMD